MNRRVGTAVGVLAAVLLLAGCDGDGDGLDDTTGEPVSAAKQQDTESNSTSNGCGPGGWALLCGDTDTTTDVIEVSPERMALAARHEAGHKAVADEYGWTVTSVVIRPDGSGKTTVWGLVWKDPQQRLTFYYAGAVAAGSEEGAWGDDTTKGDYEYADDILADYSPDEADRMETASRSEAGRIVAKRAAEIDRDTAILLDKGRL